jgi:DNA-damage-inducible protein J
MQEATINVRLPRSLKDKGDAVLRREGVSVSEALRSLYEHMGQQQELPEFMQKPTLDDKEAECAKKRALLRQISGILPADANIDGMRHERLQRHLRPGERL